MTNEQLRKIMRKYVVLPSEIDDVIYFVQDLLEFQANELKETEPYATNSIRRLEDAAREMSNLLDYIENIMEV